MKVLMFGWEFPPHISGGLGTACAGLTRALESERVETLFVIPRLHGGEQASRTTFINASSIPIRQQASGSDSNSAAGARSVKSVFREPSETSGPQGAPGPTMLEIPSFLAAYTAPEESASFGIEHWNYSLDLDARRALPPRERHDTHLPTTTQQTYAKKPYAFSGTYGKNLFEEVERYARVAAEVGRQNSFDIVHAHDWMTFPAGLAAREASGKPLIVHVHATEIDRSGTHVNAQVFAIEQDAMQQADKVVTVSQWTKDIAVEHYGVEASKIEVIHNGITPKASGDASAFAPPLDAPIVTFLGRITHQKGPLYFVEAARKVHEQFPNVHFVVAGSGDQLPRMIQRTAQVRLSEYFHFTGFLKGEDLGRIWAISTVYVMPSVSEPFGIAPLEAIQAGVPVIISRQAGVSEVMPHAIKVDFWDSAALGDAICNVLRYKSLANTLKKNSAEEIKTITWEKAAKKLTTLYHELTESYKNPQKHRPLFSGSSTAPLAHAALF